MPVQANEASRILDLNHGGEIDIDEHASSTFTTCRVVGGVCTVRRGGTTFEVGPEGRLVQLDPDASATTVNLWGGQLDWRGGDITTLNWYAGWASLALTPKVVAVTNLNIYPTAGRGEVRSLLAGVTVTNTNYIGGGPVLGGGMGR